MMLNDNSQQRTRIDPCLVEDQPQEVTVDQIAEPRSNGRGRREFLASTAAMSALPLFASQAMGGQAGTTESGTATTQTPAPLSKSIIGQYGSWGAGLAPEPPLMSFRRQQAVGIETWRRGARAKAVELLSSPADVVAAEIELVRHEQFDGLDIEHLRWRLPYGRATEAVLLKPQGATGPLPAVLGLHDHGGNKYFGYRKIVHTADAPHPLMTEHQQQYYGGKAWANELAHRGYVVLVHDTFAFGSRRVLYQDMSEIPWGACQTAGLSDDEPELNEHIEVYNQWAGEHEHIMAKSLFCSGTTWPGVFLAEDQAALSVLCARPEVDGARVGCAGLSGGGLRTVYLGGIDDRIACAVCVGFMSTWRDFLMHKAYTHTWMTYAPLLPNFLEFPEILGLRAPLPTMTQSCTDDALYTVAEMERADDILQAVFAKAGATQQYSGRFYPGGHQFDRTMQVDAFDWFDRWLT